MCQLFRHVEIIPYHSVLCRWLSAIQNKIIKIVQWFFTIFLQTWREFSSIIVVKLKNTIKKTLSSIVIILWSVCAECYVAIKNLFSRFFYLALGGRYCLLAIRYGFYGIARYANFLWALTVAYWSGFIVRYFSLYYEKRTNVLRLTCAAFFYYSSEIRTKKRNSC